SRGVLHIRDSSLRMDRLVTLDDAKGASQDAPWAGRIQIPSATVRVIEPLRFDGRFKIWSQDLRPLLAIYAARQNLPRWLEEGLNVKDLNIKMKVRADERSLVLSELLASAEKLRI